MLLVTITTVVGIQAGLFAAAGVSKIRLTGGEPTLRADIVPLTAALRALPGVEAVGITTNALALKRKLADLQSAGACGAPSLPLAR
jgi:cyclic pyranopterin phosphate synthase